MFKEEDFFKFSTRRNKNQIKYFAEMTTQISVQGGFSKIILQNIPDKFQKNVNFDLGSCVKLTQVFYT